MNPSLMQLGKKIMQSKTRHAKPYKLNFALTYRCNSRCKICGIWKKTKKNELTTKEIRKFAEKNSFSWISLTGGEPFLRDDMFEVISAFRKKLYILSITTNGLDPEKTRSVISRISKLGIHRVMAVVSLDGPREVHNSIRGIKDAWTRSLKTYQLLKDIKGIDVLFGYTISPHNLGFFRETYEKAKEIITDLTPRDFHVNLFHTSNHYYSNTGLLDRGLALKEVEEIKKISGRAWNATALLKSKYINLARLYLKTGRTPVHCASLRASIFLGPEGNVYPCTIFDKKIGNIRKSGYSLDPLLSSKKYTQIRKQTGKECPHCWSPCEAYQSIIENMKCMLTA